MAGSKDETVLIGLHLKKTQEFLMKFYELNGNDRPVSDFQRWIGLLVDQYCKDFETPQKKRKAMVIHLERGRGYL